MNERIIVITGASSLAPDVVDRIPPDAILLAVDGGLDHALAAGLEPSGLIGDLDSITETGLNWAARHATIDRHPPDKEQTDTELALAFAAAMDPLHLTLIGGGDRLDHSLAAIGALGAPGLTSIPTVDGWWGSQHFEVLHGPGKTTLHLVGGSVLSLLALHGRCTKVSIKGARWELDKVTLEPMIGRGISNEVPVPTDDGPDGERQDRIVAGVDAGVDIGVDIEVSLSSGVLTIFDVPFDETPVDETPVDGGLDGETADDESADAIGERS
jgi:thiamine pyrophosphokinase